MNDYRMSRRSFLKATSLGLLCSCADSGLLHAQSREGNRRKPNVIFIITDDQKLESFGFIKGKALTPNIDRLASEGVYFSHGYASTSVCTPSRYTCMTGRYASRSRVDKFTRGISEEGQTWVHWNADMAYDETNVAKALKSVGYATGIVGKLHGFELPGHSKETTRKSDPNDPAIARILRTNQQVFAEGLKKHGFDFAERLRAREESYAKNPAKRPKTIDPEARVTHIHRFPGGDGAEHGSALKHYAENYFDADQLYDLENDPRERTNLADDPKYKSVLEKLKAELKAHLALAPGTFAEFKKADPKENRRQRKRQL